MLTSEFSAHELDLIWKWGLCRWSNSIRSLRRALMPCDCPCKKKRFGHRQTHSWGKHCVKLKAETGVKSSASQGGSGWSADHQQLLLPTALLTDFLASDPQAGEPGDRELVRHFVTPAFSEQRLPLWTVRANRRIGLLSYRSTGRPEVPFLPPRDYGGWG